jgi:hypothetical protein
LIRVADQAWADAQARDDLSVVSRREVRLAASHAFTEAVAVTDIAYHAAGVDAVAVGTGFERLLRDVRTAAQQYQGREDHYQAVGRDILSSPDT